MRISKSVFILFVFELISARAWACSPVANFQPPSLKDNFRNSSGVVFGFVEKWEELKEGGFKVQIQVKKAWKGALAGKLSTTAAPGSTCDGFGPTAVVGSGCVLFLDTSNKILSGINTGESSFCIPAGSPKLKTLIAKYDARFKATDEKTDCAALGGQWEGTETGRGRLTGCNLPTADGGKKCSRGDQCESVCLKDGTCHGWSLFKGCAHYRGHEGVQCIE